MQRSVEEFRVARRPGGARGQHRRAVPARHQRSGWRRPPRSPRYRGLLPDRLPSRQQHLRQNTGRRRFTKSAVRVKRPGLQVRSRSGFFGAPDRETQSAVAGARSRDRARPALAVFASGIHVRLTPAVRISPEVPARYLTNPAAISTRTIFEFTDEPGGWHQAVRRPGGDDLRRERTRRRTPPYSHLYGSRPQRLYEEALKKRSAVFGCLPGEKARGLSNACRSARYKLGKTWIGQPVHRGARYSVGPPRSLRSLSASSRSSLIKRHSRKAR